MAIYAIIVYLFSDLQLSIINTHFCNKVFNKCTQVIVEFTVLITSQFLIQEL